MPSRRLLVPILVVGLAAPSAVAVAAVPNIDVWSGKSRQHELGVSLSEDAAGGAVYVDVAVPCEDASGEEATVSLQAHRLARHGRVAVSHVKVPDGIGTLTLSSTVVAHRKAVGKLSYALSAKAGSCTGKDTFSLKWAVSHGG